MSIADAIAVMKAKGMDPADILDVVEAMADRPASTGKEKSAGAARQARYRERKMASESVTRDVTRDVTSVTHVSDACYVTSVTSDVTRDAPSLSKEKNKKRERSQASRITPDWRAVDGDYAYAISKGLSPSQVDREAEKFRNHFVATGKKYFDWSKAWQNWVLRAADFIGCQPVSSPATPIEVTPRFETEEEFQEWWTKRQLAK